VEPGGKLRWIASEETAKKIYGVNWAKKIKDVADSFFVNYDAAGAISNPVSDKHPAGSLIKYAGSGNIYYVADNGLKRLIANMETMTANNFRNEFVLETDSSYNDGVNITAGESGLKTTAGN
jgi:hypothetical protein